MAVDAPSGLSISLFLHLNTKRSWDLHTSILSSLFFSGEGKGKLAISALVFLKGDLNSSLNVNRKALYPVGL